MCLEKSQQRSKTEQRCRFRPRRATKSMWSSATRFILQSNKMLQSSQTKYRHSLHRLYNRGLIFRPKIQIRELKVVEVVYPDSCLQVYRSNQLWSPLCQWIDGGQRCRCPLTAPLSLSPRPSWESLRLEFCHREKCTSCLISFYNLTKNAFAFWVRIALYWEHQLPKAWSCLFGHLPPVLN